ncbi:MAG: protein kinase [Candidatus Wallbacteria bacterium]|nr:protein kinase [Candidatus Wallbacteria bacterium]
MHQFDCPGCSTPIYSKRPQEAGGFRCLMCGFSAPAVEAEPSSGTKAEAPAAPPGPPAAPALPEEWELMDLLGKGGMGQVWRARHRLTDEEVAIKCLIGEHVEEPQYAKRFAREVQVLHRLRHPNVTGLKGSGIFQKRPWLAMELVRGSMLRARMTGQPMPPADALRLALEITRALEYTHENGVIHRDLKPENVLIDHEGTAKVTDFGLAGLEGPVSGQRLTSVGMVMGTFDYMAPEQSLDSSAVGPPADLYSLGVMLFEMLTGRKPFGQEMPSIVVSGLPRQLDALVVGLLERDPARRPSAAQAAELLDGVLSQLTGRTGPRPSVAAGSPGPGAGRPLPVSDRQETVRPSGSPLGPLPIMFAEPSVIRAAPDEAVAAQPSQASLEASAPTAPPRVTDAVSSAQPIAGSAPAPGAPGAAPPTALSKQPRVGNERRALPRSAVVAASVVTLLAVVIMVVFHKPALEPVPPPVAPPVTALPPAAQPRGFLLDSVPSNARIFKPDGTDTGKRTPHQFEDLPEGEVKFILKLEGFDDGPVTVGRSSGKGAVVQLNRVAR